MAKKNLVKELISVEVAYAGFYEQSVFAMDIALESTVLDAITASGILVYYPEIREIEKRVGIFGQGVFLETRLKAGDRIEIYRDLFQDPKDARRRKAAKVKIQRHSSTKR